MVWFVYVKGVGGRPAPVIWHDTDLTMKGKPRPRLWKREITDSAAERLSLDELTELFPYKPEETTHEKATDSDRVVLEHGAGNGTGN